MDVRTATVIADSFSKNCTRGGVKRYVWIRELLDPGSASFGQKNIS